MLTVKQAAQLAADLYIYKGMLRGWVWYKKGTALELLLYATQNKTVNFSDLLIVEEGTKNVLFKNKQTLNNSLNLGTNEKHFKPRTGAISKIGAL